MHDLDQHIRALQSLTDLPALDRAQAAAALIPASAAALAAVRADAIAELRGTMQVNAIAEVLGVSRQVVSRAVARARTHLPRYAKITLRGYDDGTPTIRFSEQLRELAPELIGESEPNRASLLIIPRRTDLHADEEQAATSAASYDMWWAHWAVTEDQPWLEDPATVTVQLVPYEHVGTLPAAPRQADQWFTDQVAALPEPTLDGWTDAHITLIGGPEAARRHVLDRQRAAIVHDRTVDAYDWAALAAITAAAVRALGRPPKLNAAQRAQVAAAELMNAQYRVHAARQSLAAHLRNAREAGETVTLPAAAGDLMA